ncbi:uncharacterized protein EI97DRAFT_100720 [Westerdykella ornata]|uniref:Uncharacterized protein n=1 Tax=Westerdykella ornata TaxID=318751 RepID=A0A6A6JE84_WESOR|nr:uncharacterized protein EI97DRAFT_100720 [Westerdykella ornata]KAF2274483.1 hypothetical protein EI97DRAFT_100720 [Westerdykella ornata]
MLTKPSEQMEVHNGSCNCIRRTETAGGACGQCPRHVNTDDYFIIPSTRETSHTLSPSATPEELALGDLMRPSSPLEQPPHPNRRGARPAMPPFGSGVITPPGEPRRLVLYGVADKSIPYPAVFAVGSWRSTQVDPKADRSGADQSSVEK